MNLIAIAAIAARTGQVVQIGPREARIIAVQPNRCPHGSMNLLRLCTPYQRSKIGRVTA